MINCFIDGACEPQNPGGNMGWGGYALGVDGEEIFSFSHSLRAGPNNNNNIAEYLALASLLDKLSSHNLNYESLLVHSDSLLVVSQMSRQWSIKSGKYVEYALACREHLNNFPLLRLQWIPREENVKADLLSKVFSFDHEADSVILPSEYNPTQLSFSF